MVESELLVDGETFFDVARQVDRRRMGGGNFSEPVSREGEEGT